MRTPRLRSGASVNANYEAQHHPNTVQQRLARSLDTARGRAYTLILEMQCKFLLDNHYTFIYYEEVISFREVAVAATRPSLASLMAPFYLVM